MNIIELIFNPVHHLVSHLLKELIWKCIQPLPIPVPPILFPLNSQINHPVLEHVLLWGQSNVGKIELAQVITGELGKAYGYSEELTPHVLQAQEIDSL